QLLAAQTGAAPDTTATGVLLTPNDWLNQITVLAPADRINEIVNLINGLDKPLELQTRVYHPKSISADRVDHLMRDLLGPSTKPKYQATVERDSGALIVSAAPSVQSQLESLLRELDVPSAAEQNPIQFYKLKNTKAADVLATIGGLMGESGLQNFTPENGEASTTDQTSAPRDQSHPSAQPKPVQPNVTPQ